MKQLHELINRDEPGWPLVQQWITAATNYVDVLPPPDDAARDRALLDMQVTTRSPMGAILYETGGIIVDDGWLRILGSGHPRLPRSLSEWNFKRSFSGAGQPPPFLLIADDVIGGFFAIDGGGLALERGKSVPLRSRHSRLGEHAFGLLGISRLVFSRRPRELLWGCSMARVAGGDPRGSRRPGVQHLSVSRVQWPTDCRAKQAPD